MSRNRIALITGSGKKRVGYHIAKYFAKNKIDIAIHYHSSKEEAKEAVKELMGFGIRAEAFSANLRVEAEIHRMVEEVYRTFGQIDILVNSAAIWESKPLEAVVADDVRKHFEINTLAVFLLTQQIGLKMVAQKEGGVIIQLGDWAEIRPYPHYAAYFPSKGGVHTLTKSMAVELGMRNPKVRVNAILPGPVMLPDDLSLEEKTAVIQATLVKREGSPQHIADAAWMLVNNDFITGVLLPVDGGRSIYSG